MKENKKIENLTKQFSNKKLLTILCIIAALFLIVYLVIILLTKKHLEFAKVFFGISIALNVLLLIVVKITLKKPLEILKNLINDPRGTTEIKKFSFLPSVFGLLCLLLFVSPIFGEAYAKYIEKNDGPPIINESPQANDDTDNKGTDLPLINNDTLSVDIPYNFSTITNDEIWKDLYFSNEKDETIFVDKLEKSLRYIFTIKELSTEELNIAHDYGDIALDAVEHQKLLKETLLGNTSKYISLGPLPKACYKHIIEVRKKMDNAIITPENRHELMNTYSLGAQKELFDKPEIKEYDKGNEEKIVNELKVEEYEKALRYAWGTLYIAIAWNDWNDWDNENTPHDCIQDLQDLYQIISNLNVQNNIQIELIINSLERLKKRFETDAPTPIVSNEDVTYNYLYGAK